MKEHTSNFETEIKTYGRQQAVQVIFEQDGQQVVLDNENVFSVTPNFKASLLKSAMKSLILDCNVEIPVGTRLKFKYGILVNNAYEYLDFGYYIVNKIEKKEDARSYEITCYDKMMLAMVDYIDLGIDYPITIRNYIAEICNYLEIDFGSNQDQFVNYDKQIPSELYLDENGNSLDYTFRDVLDELAQVTASVICIDENDNLVVKYPQLNGEYETIEGTSLYIENADDNKIDLELKGNTTQNGTPTPSSPVAVNNVTGLQTISIGEKNLFKPTLGTTTINGVTFTKNNDGTYTANGTASAFIGLEVGQFIFGSAKTITYSGAPSNASMSTYSFNLKKIVGATETWLQDELGTGKTITAEANVVYSARLIIRSGVSVSNIVFKPMIELGSTKTEFEPFSGKQYEINLGANILDIQNSWTNSKSSSQNGLRYVLNADDTISISGTSTGYSGTYVRNYNSTNVFMTLKANHKYRVLVEVSDKTSNINSRVYFGTTSANIGGFSLTSIGGNGTYYKDYIPSQDVGLTQYSVIGAESAGETSLTMKIAIYDVTTSPIDSYSPYFTPIELNKIGTHQDFIRKGTGKNILLGTIETKTANNVTITKNSGNSCTITTNGTASATTFFYTNEDTLLKANTTYLIGLGNGNNDCQLSIRPSDNSMQYANTTTTSYVTYTPTEDISVRLFVRIANGKSVNETIYPYIQEGTDTPSYEPYGYKDKWYIEKNIGKVVLNGSENWQLESSGRFRIGNYAEMLAPSSNGTLANALSNRFVLDTATNTWNKTNDAFSIDTNKGINVRYNTCTSVADLKTWIQSNNITVYYALANSTYTLIENETLIEQLDRIYLQQGLNNILVNGNLPSTLKMTYVSDLIGIDEEQLKDINVNFGEKYGPINSLVIARAADSDFIYKEDEKSVAEDGLCEVKISDNQILNGDNRTQFIDEIYNQLRGTEFYLNDFSSTGITYLDLLDYFKVKVFDNSYKCLMLNDEINITQGLQEQVFTERPKESETEYKSIAKQDKDIRKIGIIVNKVEGEITAEIIARQDTDEKVSNLTQTIGEINTTVSTTTTQVNDLETRVQTNETSISQNSDSITATISRIQKTEDDVETLETNTEDVIKQLVFGDDGLTISAKGTTSDDMKLNLTNDAIKFLYQNNAVLTINGSTIEFSNASFKKLDLGNYVWQAEDDDSLSLIYEGD